MDKGQAIRRSIIQVKHLQALRKREKQAQKPKVDATRTLAFGVCDSIAHATRSTGSFAFGSRFSMHNAVLIAMLLVLMAPVILVIIGILFN